MTKQINNKGKPDIEVLGELHDAITFVPTDIQRKVKAMFWAKQADLPFIDTAMITLNYVIKQTGTAKVKDWWEKPGFKQWFLNQDETRQRLEYLYGLALDALQEMLINTDPKAQSARVKAVQLIAELANKVPKKNDNDFIDKAIQAMDRQALLSYLEKQGIKVNKAQPQKALSDGEDDKE